MGELTLQIYTSLQQRSYLFTTGKKMVRVLSNGEIVQDSDPRVNQRTPTQQQGQGQGQGRPRPRQVHT